MIIDRLVNASIYTNLHPGYKLAFDFLQQADLVALPTGRVEIDGQWIYAMVQQYQTKQKEDGVWEAHRRYIDLQYVIQGSELLGYANIVRLAQGAYDESRDFLPLQGEGDFLTLAEGHFVILLPEDGHMPGISIHSSAPVKKIVIKIVLEWEERE
jgi:YhcH/YjgK/YiaL family protein